MYKYYMTIDGSKYNALFLNQSEADDFINSQEDETIVNKVEEVSIVDILLDKSFEYYYKVECIGLMVLPNVKELKKTSEIEKELQKLGILA